LLCNGGALFQSPSEGLPYAGAFLKELKNFSRAPFDGLRELEFE
jgi:hypothetical protein